MTSAMLTYLARRLVLAVITIVAISVLTFVIIHLPPGDFVDAYIAKLAASGTRDLGGRGGCACASPTGWTSRCTCSTGNGSRMVASGDFGRSFECGRPVTEVIGDRLWLTMALSLGAIVVTWGLALPIGIYSAVRQYSIGDYVFTFLGFIGLAVPNFLLALILMYFGFALFGLSVGGLFSADYALAPWSWAKVVGPDAASAGAGADPGAGRHRAARSASCAPTCSTSCASPMW